MAGEIEEPFNLSFQAVSIHSGSISFGRFENESLSWERRSSFSHNRYLEEVEKYSKPGSVTEMKAHFEAHFKKKGIRVPTSLEAQTWGAHQTGDNNVITRNETDCVSESNDIYRSDESFSDNTSHWNSPCNYIDNNNTNGENDQGMDQEVSHAESNPIVSYYEEVCDIGPLSVASDSTDVPVECLIEKEDDHQCLETPQEIEVREDYKDKHCYTHEPSESVDLNVEVEETSSVNNSSVPTKTALDPVRRPVSASGHKSQNNVTRFHKRVPAVSSNTSIKGKNTKDEASSRRTKGSSSSISGTNYSTKCLNESRPNKSVKAIESQSLTAKKPESRAPLAINSDTYRCKNGIDPAKQSKGKATCVNGFRLKSDERAEKRREYYMKLEEKIRVKKAEMNKGQEKTQEMAEAEMRQFRRSLNFKATPMPSFYNNSGTRPGCHNMSARPKGTPERQPLSVSKARNPRPISSHENAAGNCLSESSRCLLPANNRISDSRRRSRPFRS